jgi:hypothetical protein
MTRERVTYVYCLIRAARVPGLEKMPSGPPALSKPRLLDAGKGLWIAVSDAPLDRYGEQQLEERLRDLDWVSRCALAHEAVIEHFKKARAIVPMKLFTMFSGDQRALDFVARERRRLDGVLARVEGREEYGIRVALDEVRALRLAERKALEEAGSPSSGAGYLMRKKKVQDTFRGFSEAARAAADQVFEGLAAKADDSRRRPPAQAPGAGGRLLLDAAYLVPKKKAAAFLEAARTLGGELEAEGYGLTLTGPWPPYNFISGAA